MTTDIKRELARVERSIDRQRVTMASSLTHIYWPEQGQALLHQADALANALDHRYRLLAQLHEAEKASS